MVVLRNEQTELGSRFLSAELKENGDLVFSGLDSGKGVKDFWGENEYEWHVTIKAADIDQLINVLDQEGEILSLLQNRFKDEQAADIPDFLTKHNIPHESWSRMGD